VLTLKTNHTFLVGTRIFNLELAPISLD